MTDKTDSTQSNPEPPEPQPVAETPVAPAVEQGEPTAARATRAETHNTRRRLFQFGAYWFKLFAQPLLAIGGIILIVFLLGVGQQYWGMFDNITQSDVEAAPVDDGTEYVCPMLCVPATKVPGRCPVCAMELKPRKSSGDPKDFYGLTIEPAARRLTNIQTVAATAIPTNKKISAFGRISYDETALSTISAYVDGRIEKLFVDFTGAKVKQGDAVAILYSPDLYSAQIEVLESKKAMESSQSTNQRVIDSNKRLYESAKKRLKEFGISEAQIAEIEKTSKADSRIKITSPISGTVVEKMVVQGKYIKTGMPIFKVVDLSKVWLQLELFPEDAMRLEIGQSIDVTIQSQPGNSFQGKIAFVDPTVNPKTQSVAVRVVIENQLGLIRIGDFANATLKVAIPAEGTTVLVPQNAILKNAGHNVAYVETKPGRFEFRNVKTGPTTDGNIAVLSGIKPGEQVVTNAAFMLDAEFASASKPSLINPTRLSPEDQVAKEKQREAEFVITQALQQLSTADRKLAEAQGYCPVADFRLGEMGKPIKVDVEGQPVFICCEGCRTSLLKESDHYLARTAKYIKNQGRALPEDEPDKAPGGNPK